MCSCLENTSEGTESTCWCQSVSSSGSTQKRIRRQKYPAAYTYRYEIEVEIERSYCDLVTAHPVGLFHNRIIIDLCIEKHAGDLMRDLSQFNFLVLYIGENLVEVC